MVDLDDPVVRANALAQAHPLGPAAYRYVNAMVARERTSQPIEEIGVWAGNALIAGYCLRRVEEDRAGRVCADLPGDLPTDLDEAAIHVAGLIRTEGAEPYLLGPEADLVVLMDRLIAGEIDRRLGHWEETITSEAWDDLAAYIAWWVIKGYALRIVEVVDLPDTDP